MNADSEIKENDLWIFDNGIDISKITTWIFDLDGVVYRGDDKIDTCIDFLHFLSNNGRKVIFYSNNSSKPSHFYADKISKMGYSVDPKDIFTSSIIAANGLKKIYTSSKNVKCFVVGELGLINSMKEVGFEVINDPPESFDYTLNIPKELIVDLVIAGVDQYFTYHKLRWAMGLILKGANYYASNLDTTLPIGETFWPGSGAINAAITTAVGKKPQIVFGKPSPEGFEILLKTLGISKEQSIMIGDRLETDILGAMEAQIPSILVGTGVSSLKEVLERHTTIKPSIYVKDLSKLKPYFDLNF